MGVRGGRAGRRPRGGASEGLTVTKPGDADSPRGDVLAYEAPDGGVRVEVKLDRDTVWLTQRQMAELFETTPENVLMHLKNIYADAELEEPTTAKDFLAVRTEGKRQVQRRLNHYNLDAIISVGYRVNSRRGVRFRQWATQTLRDHLVRGYTIDRQRVEHNARELEAALALVRKAAATDALSTEHGPGPRADQARQARGRLAQVCPLPAVLSLSVIQGRERRAAMCSGKIPITPKVGFLSLSRKRPTA